jgi:predicted nucleic acid-binding protein
MLIEVQITLVKMLNEHRFFLKQLKDVIETLTNVLIIFLHEQIQVSHLVQHASQALIRLHPHFGCSFNDRLVDFAVQAVA